MPGPLVPRRAGYVVTTVFSSPPGPGPALHRAPRAAGIRFISLAADEKLLATGCVCPHFAGESEGRSEGRGGMELSYALDPQVYFKYSFFLFPPKELKMFLFPPFSSDALGDLFCLLQQ